jgi:c-di-GMP-binding flagellar brake protein YcgR
MTEPMTTQVLEVDSGKRQFFFDVPMNAAQAARLAESDRITFEGTLDRIKISFVVHKADVRPLDGDPALCSPFPERLVRLQRREHFRMPISNATIHIPSEGDDEDPYREGRVRDLSPNGVCLIDTSMALDNTVGRTYSGCRLNLPETQPLTVTFEIRNSHEITMPDNSRQHRIGCRFLDLSSAESALIQRYITRLEKMQK